MLFSRLRHRAWYAAFLFVLSTLTVAAFAAGPFYERAVEQASLQATLGEASPAARGIAAHADTIDDALAVLPKGDTASLFRAPVTGSDNNNLQTTLQGKNYSATVSARSELCAHLTMVAGRCPQGVGEIVVSSTSASALSLRLGQPVTLSGVVDGGPSYPLGTAHIVGVYRVFDADDDYWFGRTYSSATGTYTQSQAGAVSRYVDTFFISASYAADLMSQVTQFNNGRPAEAPLPDPFDRYAQAALLVHRVGIDDTAQLRAAAEAATAAAQTASNNGQSLSVGTNLPNLLDTVEHARSQSRSIIPAFALQLALVVLAVMAMVVAAEVEERQPELALGRLRGRGARSAAGPFLTEAVALVGGSLVPGLALSWFVTLLLARRQLPPGTSLELRWAPVAAALGGALLALAIFAILVLRAARRPVLELLRTVPRTVGRRGLGVFEAMIFSASVAGVVVALSGDRHNLLVSLVPALLAVAAGLLAAQLAAWACSAIGRRLLWRGRLGAAMAALQAARRSGFRRVVLLVCITTALVIAAVDQWSVAAENRSRAAGVQVGAPVVLTTAPTTPSQLQQAVKAADPAERFAVPVVLQQSENAVSPVIATDPVAFAAAASWVEEGDRPPAKALAQLSPPAAAAPIRVTGDHLQLTGDSSLIRTLDSDSTAGPVSLRFELRRTDGSMTSADVVLPEGHVPGLVLNVPISGCLSGCQVRRLSLQRSPSDNQRVQLALRISQFAVATGNHLTPVSLGTPNDWGTVPPADGAAPAGPDEFLRLDADPSGSGLALTAVNEGSDAAIRHRDLPDVIPAISGGSLPPSGATLGIDGLPQTFGVVSQAPYLPRLGTVATPLLTDLTLAIAASGNTTAGDTFQVWLSSDDPGQERALVAALRTHGVTIAQRETAAHAQRLLAQTPPAWAVTFALLVALVATLVAMLMIIAVALTSRGPRRTDLAAMRLVGVRGESLRRAGVGEQLLGVLLGVIVGTVAGVVGAALVLPSLPIFSSPPLVPISLLATAWPSVLLSTLVAALLFGAVGWAVALAVTSDSGAAERPGGLQ
ncbi:FtsX-like permease family protein [Frankineae bacterium MT45]|nr:FtsX-like permease family protein [Frankineae bacterium MT45]